MRTVLFGLAIAAIAVLAPIHAEAGEAADNVYAQKIAHNLKYSGKMRDYRVGVACKDGTAWLSGTVSDANQMATAVEIARRTEGIHEVVNRLTIAGQPAPVAEPTPADEIPTEAEPRSSRNGVQLTGAANQADGRAIVQTAQQPSVMAAPQPMPAQAMQQARPAQQQMPVGYGPASVATAPGGYGMPIPAYVPGAGGVAPAAYDAPHMPNYAWPSYAAYPNYAGVTYPRQYSPTAWPYIGPFYPYPQVPLGWRKVTLEWDDGWWMLDFKDKHH